MRSRGGVWGGGVGVETQSLRWMCNVVHPVGNSHFANFYSYCSSPFDTGRLILCTYSLCDNGLAQNAFVKMITVLNAFVKLIAYAFQNRTADIQLIIQRLRINTSDDSISAIVPEILRIGVVL